MRFTDLSIASIDNSPLFAALVKAFHCLLVPGSNKSFPADI